jgi:hypothetical protein
MVSSCHIKNDNADLVVKDSNNSNKATEIKEIEEDDYISQFKSKLINLGYIEEDNASDDEFTKIYDDKIYKFVFNTAPSGLQSSTGFDVCKKEDIYNCSYYSLVTNYGMVGYCLYDFSKNKTIKGYNCNSRDMNIIKNTKELFINEFSKTNIDLNNVFEQYKENGLYRKY